MPINFPKGSEWRKWDLHLHTPDSRLEQGFNGDWDTYLDTLSASDTYVYGITNYFCFCQDELEKARNGFAKRGVNKTVLGNLEFRINQPNKDNEFINVHVLFSERLSTDEINKSIAHMPLINTADSKGTKTIYCCDDDVSKAGLNFSNILISFEILIEHLESHFNTADYLVACCPSGYGSFRPARGEGRGAKLALEMDKDCDIAFGDYQDRIFFLNTGRYEGASQKPVAAGSDAHKFEELGRRFCWVKAHPTFEGFRQVLFEPEERISLDASHPGSNFPKPYFSNLEAEGNIVSNELLAYELTNMPINASLVTLIGGRGSGKSILLDCVYKRFHLPSSKDSGRLLDIEPHRFLVDFTKQDGSDTKTYDVGAEETISYLHVRQGDIRRIAENPDALSDEIKRLLGIAPIEGQDQIGLDMESILEQIEDIKRWLLFEDENGQKINTKNFNEKIIKSNEERIKAITSKENKELVENYNNNAGAISRINTARQKLVGLKSKITQFEQDIAREISSINSILQPYKLSIPQIDTSLQITSLDEVTKRLVSEGEELAKNNSTIQQQLRERGIEQDPAGLLDKVSVFQKAITEARQRIEDIKSRTTTLSELLDRRKEMADALMETLHKGSLIVNSAFSSLKKGRNGWTENQISLVNRLLSEVNITGEVFFDQAVFYQGLLNVLNGRKFRQSGGMTQPERLNAKFNINNFNDFKRFLSGDQIIINDDDGLINAEQFSRLKDYFASYDGYSFLEYLYLPRFQQRYLRVKAFIKYKNKDPNRLSVGQRGTFYVCMKLATDPFGSPFIFDQPEDDLDNDFIVRELVPLFKEIKKYRQIIIATHNANLVVNADAEQIIVASNEDEELSYISGALEDQKIRDAVCTILEGGEDAFLKRESKYDFG